MEAPEDIIEDLAALDLAVTITDPRWVVECTTIIDRLCRTIITTWVEVGTVLTAIEVVADAFSP